MPTDTTENTDSDLTPDPLEAFVAAFNVVYPDWEINGDPDTDLTAGRVKYSDRLTSVHARCGITGLGRPLFKVNTDVWARFSTEEQVRLLAHELGHINHFDHSPDFWFNAGKNIERFIRNADKMEAAMGDSICWPEVIEDMVLNPSDNMVDLRQNTVWEQRMELADQLGYSGLEPFSGMKLYRTHEYRGGEVERVGLSEIDFEVWSADRVLDEVWNTRPREGIERNGSSYVIPPVPVTKTPEGMYATEEDGLLSLAHYTFSNPPEVYVEIEQDNSVSIEQDEREKAD